MRAFHGRGAVVVAIAVAIAVVGAGAGALVACRRVVCRGLVPRDLGASRAYGGGVGGSGDLGAGAPPAEAPDRKQAEVALERSFRLPQDPGREVSHMPAVVFGPDGKRLFTATSAGEVVVFDAATRGIALRVSF